jgi:hypothetical protein
VLFHCRDRGKVEAVMLLEHVSGIALGAYLIAERLTR